MGKTIYYVASSLDGYIADSNDGLDWLMQFGFDHYREHYEAFIANVGAVAMGSKTYEFVLNEGPDAWHYTMPAWVLTTRELPGIAGKDITFTSMDIVELHREMVEAAAGKDIWLVGGGAVVAGFHELGLVDEMHVTYMPIVLGDGKPLLPVAHVTEPLELLQTTHFESGAVELRYKLV